MEPITLIALGAGALYLMRGKPKTKSTGPKPIIKPGMVRLNAADTPQGIVFAPSKDQRAKIEDNEAAITIEKLPVEILVSVPAGFKPPKVAGMTGARLTMGTSGETADLVFRVNQFQPRQEGATSIRLDLEYESDGAIRTGPLWIAVHAPMSKQGVYTKIYEGDQGVWWFGGFRDGALMITDGPYTSDVVAQKAADNWKSAQTA